MRGAGPRLCALPAPQVRARLRGASESLDVQLAAASLQIFTRADDGQLSKLTVSSQLVIEHQSTRSNLFRRRTDLISTRHSLQVTRLAARTPTRTSCTLAVKQVMMATLLASTSGLGPSSDSEARLVEFKLCFNDGACITAPLDHRGRAPRGVIHDALCRCAGVIPATALRAVSWSAAHEEAVLLRPVLVLEVHGRKPPRVLATLRLRVGQHRAELAGAEGRG